MPDHVTASMVLYNNGEAMVAGAVGSILESSLVDRLYVVDNSPNKSNMSIMSNDRVDYIHTENNSGYGPGHNIAMRLVLNGESKYHIVANPDIVASGEVIESLNGFMDFNSDVGLVMPKVLYPDGSIQYLCKLLPSPYMMLIRRLLPFKKLRQKRNQVYEMRFTDYERTMDVPCLSGCFMFLRTDVLRNAGLFDERYFMYFEDVDLCRRIRNYSRLVYFSEAGIFHNYSKGSYKNGKLFMHHIASAVRYFNKWGWVFDSERKRINQETLDALGYKNARQGKI